MKYLAGILFLLSFNSNKPKIAPPGTIFLTDHLYIDYQPITNWSWQEYLFMIWRGYAETNQEIPYLDKKHEINFVYNDSIVDKASTLLKNNEYAIFDLDSIYNYKEKKYTKSVGFKGGRLNKITPLDYPVLNVWLDEAEEYCSWRTKVVMFSYAHVNKHKRKKFYTKIRYRVPTTEELKLAKEKYPSLSDQAYYISNPEIDLDFLNHKFVEITSDNPIKPTINRSEYTTGFRCVCEILEY